MVSLLTLHPPCRYSFVSDDQAPILVNLIDQEPNGPANKFYLLPALMFVILLICDANGQTVPDRGLTLPSVAPGAPIGSQLLSEIERNNLFNGNLDINIPLLNVSGRGQVGYPLSVTIDRTPWRMDLVKAFNGSTLYFPGLGWFSYRGNSNFAFNTTPGKLVGRKVYTVHPCSSSINLVGITLTRLTWVSSDGTEYALVDEGTHGQPHDNNPPTETDPPLGLCRYTPPQSCPI